jgi:hypothetical protein
VRFHATSPADADHGDGYDLVTAFECIHDMPQPVPVLRAMRAMAGSDGTVIVMDENVQPQFVAPGDEIERLMYGFSTLVCLPDAMSHEGSVGTGTVMRPSTFEGYATDAGFSGIEILPIDGGSGASTGPPPSGLTPGRRDGCPVRCRDPSDALDANGPGGL